MNSNQLKILKLLLIIGLSVLTRAERNELKYDSLFRSKRQLCGFYCGDGDCVETTHPTHKYACRCRDGTYKFEICKSISNNLIISH